MVSAVILAYNRCSEVLFTIEKMKILSTTLPFELEIVAVDNASIDDTSEQIREKHPDVTLVTKEKNNGVAGWNDGFKVAKHKYFLVLDDDSHVETGLSEAVSYLEQKSEVGILALNVTTGPYPTWQTRWRDKEDIHGFSGCGAIIRKAVYEKIGGFAEWLHVYAHEWDYALRAMDAGYKIQYFENSNVDHRANPVNRTAKRFWIYSTRNEMAVVYKHFGNDRWKYVMNMWANNFKPLKAKEYSRVYYSFIGAIKFLQIRKTLDKKPVAPRIQKFFAESFDNTYPFFYFLTRRINTILSRKKP